MSNPYRGQIKVRFADTDANGHAFFGNYFVFADEVLGEYWSELGLDVADVVNPDFLTFTVNANMDFLGESLAGDTLEQVAARDNQAATDDAGDGTRAALAQRQARAPRVGARVVGLDRRHGTLAINAAHHPHLRLPVLILHDGRAGIHARAAHRRDRPPPPACKHRAVGSTVTSITSRDDEAVLHEPSLHALLQKLRRSKKGFEPAADDVQRAVRHERRAREQAQDQIIAEPVEEAWRVEAPRAPRHY